MPGFLMLRQALGSTGVNEDACTLIRLSDCLSQRSFSVNLLEDLNKSVEYAAEAVKRLADQGPKLYPGFVTFHASRLLARATLCRDSKIVQQDWENAVALCRKAVLASVHLCRERDKKIKRRPSDFGDMAVKRTTTQSSADYDSTVLDDVFSMLQVMTNILALDVNGLTADVAKSICEAKVATIPEVKALLSMCRTALRRTGEMNTIWCLVIGDALCATHLVASATATDEKKSGASEITNLTTNDLQQAIECFQKAVDSAQYHQFTLRDAKSCLGHALLHRKTGTDLDDAVTCYRVAAAIDKEETPYTLKNLAFALKLRDGPGDKDQAVTLYRKAINIGTTADWVRQFCAIDLVKLLDSMEHDPQELLDLRRLVYQCAKRRGLREYTFKQFANALVLRGQTKDLDEASGNLK
jgi:tetratricopeptide (TPR) repeat protein